MNKLIRKLVMKLGVGWVTGQIRAVAEGKKGPKLKALYWSLAGKKRLTGIILVAVSGALAMMGEVRVAEGMVLAGGFLVQWGWLDKNWRAVDLPQALASSKLWQFLAHNSPTITAGLAAAFWWLHGDTCSLAEWCARGEWFVTLVGAVGVQVGLLDATWKAPAPANEPPASPPRPNQLYRRGGRYA